MNCYTFDVIQVENHVYKAMFVSTYRCHSFDFPLLC